MKIFKADLGNLAIVLRSKLLSLSTTPGWAFMANRGKKLIYGSKDNGKIRFSGTTEQA